MARYTLRKAVHANLLQAVGNTPFRAVLLSHEAGGLSLGSHPEYGLSSVAQQLNPVILPAVFSSGETYQIPIGFRNQEMLMLTNIILLAAAAGIIYYLLRPRKKRETTQELINFKDVSDDGMIELPGNKYRVVLEVIPVNMALRSFEEQAAIWAGFRSMLNSFIVPCTFLIQTRFLNISNYIELIKQQSANLPGTLASYADDLSSWLNKKIEGKTIRDRRYFIILKTDASLVTEEGIRVESEMFDIALKAISNMGKIKLSSKEVETQAKDQLQEAKNIVLGSLSGVDIAVFPLDKKGVLDMLYQTFNRDSAVFMEQSFDKTPVMYPTSNTPDTVLKKLA
jgi:hypothetical protein